jgi:hypothetical protein
LRGVSKDEATAGPRGSPGDAKHRPETRAMRAPHHEEEEQGRDYASLNTASASTACARKPTVNANVRNTGKPSV